MHNFVDFITICTPPLLLPDSGKSLLLNSFAERNQRLLIALQRETRKVLTAYSFAERNQRGSLCKAMPLIYIALRKETRDCL